MLVGLLESQVDITCENATPGNYAHETRTRMVVEKFSRREHKQFDALVDPIQAPRTLSESALMIGRM